MGAIEDFVKSPLPFPHYSTLVSIRLNNRTQDSNMTELYLPKEVVDKDGRRAIVVSVTVVPLVIGGKGTEQHDIKLDNFLETYTEYVDPKDLEIARLLKQLADLKAKHKPARKKKRTLTALERAEVRTLIANGENNTAIATQYDISDSSVSRMRKTMEKTDG